MVNRVGEVMEGPVEAGVEEGMGGLEGTGDQAAAREGTAAVAAEVEEEDMEAAGESRARNDGRERMWSFLVRGLGGGLAENHPGVIGRMTVRAGRAG